RLNVHQSGQSTLVPPVRPPRDNSEWPSAPIELSGRRLSSLPPARKRPRIGIENFQALQQHLLWQVLLPAHQRSLHLVFRDLSLPGLPTAKPASLAPDQLPDIRRTPSLAARLRPGASANPA